MITYKSKALWLAGGFLATVGLFYFEQDIKELTVFAKPIPSKPTINIGRRITAEGFKIGDKEKWIGAGGRTYTLELVGIEKRPMPEDWIIPTNAQFDEWLAYTEAGGELGLQEWLSEQQ